MNKNYFKFSVSYRNNIISERVFDAECYNPIVRQMVNIKELVPEIRKVLQKILSIPNQRLSNEFYAGINDVNKPVLIDLLPQRHPVKEIYVSNNSYLKDRNINRVNIERTLKNINDKFMIVISLRDGTNELFYAKNILVDDNSIKDVQAKSSILFENIKQIEFVEELLFDFSLHLNDNYIIQRKFTVFNFNPNSIFSEDFIKVVNEICQAIKNHIKNSDIAYQYIDYEIMNKHEMAYNELKTLSQEEKKKLLRTEYSYN
jgi:hypothetical protein